MSDKNLRDLAVAAWRARLPMYPIVAMGFELTEAKDVTAKPSALAIVDNATKWARAHMQEPDALRIATWRPILESELEFLAMRLETYRRRGMNDDETLRTMLVRGEVQVDIAYYLARQGGYLSLSAELLPGALWVTRTSPGRGEILRKLLCSRKDTHDRTNH